MPVTAPASTSDPNPNPTLYSYNPEGERTGMTDPIGHSETDLYDADGNVTEVIDLAKKTLWAKSSSTTISQLRRPKASNKN
jgi:YD repeat-containing protein